MSKEAIKSRRADTRRPLKREHFLHSLEESHDTIDTSNGTARVKDRRHSESFSVGESKRKKRNGVKCEKRLEVPSGGGIKYTSSVLGYTAGKS